MLGEEETKLAYEVLKKGLHKKKGPIVTEFEIACYVSLASISGG